MLQFHSFVYLIGSGELGCGLTHKLDCNVYLLDCGGSLALVDAGCGLEPERILEQVMQAGFAPDSITRLFLTHYHADHIGGVHGLISLLPQLQVFGSELTLDAVAMGDEERSCLALGREVGVFPRDFTFEPCPGADLRFVNDGDRIRLAADLEITVIASPGHCAGHCMYLLRAGDARHLFSGDCLFAGGRIVLQNVPDCILSEYVETLRKLRDLRVDGLFPGHLFPILNEASRHIQQANAFLDRGRIPENAF